MIKRVVTPPYDNYDLSTFVIHNDTVYIGHFGGGVDKQGKVLSTVEEQFARTLETLKEELRTTITTDFVDKNCLVQIDGIACY